MSISKRESLLSAAQTGNLNEVKQLIAEDKTIIDCKDNESRTPLLNAAWNGHLPVVEFLVSQGANVNSKTSNNMTPLLAAASYGYGPTAEYLIEHKADISQVTRSGKTALIYTAGEAPSDGENAERYYDCARRLVRYLNPNIQDQDGMTALMHAKSNPKMFDILLEAKSNIELTDKSGRTVFLQLCGGYHDRSDVNSMKKLIAKNVNVNAVDNNKNSALDLILDSNSSDKINKQKITTLLEAKQPMFKAELKDTAVNKAIKSNQTKKLDLLSQCGINPKKELFNALLNAAYDEKKFDRVEALLDEKEAVEDHNVEEVVDKDGNSLLMRAIRDRKSDIADKLVKFSNVTVRNKKGETPLQLAIEYNQIELAEKIIESGASPDELDNNNDSLLIRFIYDTERALMLLNNGASVEVVDSDGQTPLIAAASCHNDTVVKAILKRNPKNINAQNNEKRTALFTAVYKGITDSDYKETVLALINAGADPYIKCEGNFKLTDVFEIGGMRNSLFGEQLKEYKRKIDSQAKGTTLLSTVPHAITFKPANPPSVKPEADQKPTHSMQV